MLADRSARPYSSDPSPQTLIRLRGVHFSHSNQWFRRMLLGRAKSVCAGRKRRRRAGGRLPGRLPSCHCPAAVWGRRSIRRKKPMSYSMSQALLPIVSTGLEALSGIIDKAAAHAAAKKIDPSVLLSWRLAPDMFAFARQVQVTCDQAKNGPSRLAGIDPPKFEDNETTVEQLKERVAKTLAHVRSL